ncbi:MAG: multicopper oxidase family protein [Omnitrophica WOR_2 bacterium]
MINRREFLKLGVASGGAFILARAKFFRTLASYQIPQTPLLVKNIQKFVEPLPVFGSSDGLEPGEVNAPRVTGTDITVTANEIQQCVLPASFYSSLPAPYNAGTYVWAYNVGDTLPLYPGITIEARRNTPTAVTYVNDLHGDGGGLPILQQYLTIDQTLHWANPLKLDMDSDEAHEVPYSGPPPLVTHLHGAEVASEFDGGPDEWFTPNGIHGSGYRNYNPADPGANGNGAVDTGPANSSTYHYVNEQEAATLWFHDHTLGATRINVYAGLAAFYLLRDEFDTGLPDNPLGLPAGPYEREIAIQDRQFDENGQWLFPDGDPDGENGPPPNPDLHPFWNPEFFGDVIVVNGKSWPYFNVEPRRYRFRLLDGCNARFLELRLENRAAKRPGPAFWIIGTDGGLLDMPVMLNNPKAPGGKAPRLLMAPGERYDVIMDFSGFAGQTLTLINSAKAPYPAGTSPDPSTVGQVMQFRVTLPLSSTDTSYDPALGQPLRKSGSLLPIVRLADPAMGTLAEGITPAIKRQLTLVEIEGEGGPEEVLVNNTKWAGKRNGIPIPGYSDDGQGNFLSELPLVGTTEVWEIINTTMDAHPIHLHLTQFQLINRQMYNATQYRAVYEASFPDGEFIPRYGPPLDYFTPNPGGYLGGNPDITPFLQDGTHPPLPEEAGWKDTVKMYPGQVTRIAVRFTPQDIALGLETPGTSQYGFDPAIGLGYVWHCHIVDHEDNEMMRPYNLLKS